MPSKNSKIKSKSNTALVAWANLAKDDTFAGMTLTQFSQMVGDTEEQLNQIAALSVSYTGAAKQSDDLHQKLNDAIQALVSGVRADVTKYGPDSPLYKAMGYVPKSERASGLTRKTTKTATTQASTTPAASLAAGATSGGLKVLPPATSNVVGTTPTTTGTTTTPTMGSTAATSGIVKN
jgi:hypothetical protein